MVSEPLQSWPPLTILSPPPISLNQNKKKITKKERRSPRPPSSLPPSLPFFRPANPPPPPAHHPRPLQVSQSHDHSRSPPTSSSLLENPDSNAPSQKDAIFETSSPLDRLLPPLQMAPQTLADLALLCSSLLSLAFDCPSSRRSPPHAALTSSGASSNPTSLNLTDLPNAPRLLSSLASSLFSVHSTAWDPSSTGRRYPDIFSVAAFLGSEPHQLLMH